MARQPSPIKQLLRINGLWWRYYCKREKTIRPVVVDNIIKVLACGLSLLGFATWRCPNNSCSHTKAINFSCKSRFCNTCGTKRTNQWIETQQAILPETPWRHIVFTMPDELWPIFKANRPLLGKLSRLAAHILLKRAKEQRITPGIFTALHTFGRDLKWNTHVHLSITDSGISDDHSQWKTFNFCYESLMPQWRYAVIILLRKTAKKGSLILPKHVQSMQQWERFLDHNYNKHWQVRIGKPTETPKHTLKYLGRYVSRPPLAMSKLKHYDGQTVIFSYLDHKTKTYRRFSCDGEAFIDRLTQHIPEKGFRLIRYYGFLANRLRSTLLPKVYALLGQSARAFQIIRYLDLLQSTFGVNPITCILCQSTLVFDGITLGKPLNRLHQYHKNLALMKPV